MRILGIDLGSRTVGMAISDYLGIIATPIGTTRITENSLQEALECVKIVVKERGVEKIVLGLPKNMDGTQGFQSQYSLDFKAMLEEELKLPVIMLDERLTTRMAHNTMLQADMSRKKRKQNVDKIAATIILQSYLDSLPKY